VLVTAGADGAIRTWDMATRQQLTTLQGTAATPFTSMALSEDGGNVAAVDSSGVVVWNLSSRTPRRVP
jgi:WD40 repeat protein